MVVKVGHGRCLLLRHRTKLPRPEETSWPGQTFGGHSSTNVFAFRQQQPPPPHFAHGLAHNSAVCCLHDNVVPSTHLAGSWYPEGHGGASEVYEASPPRHLKDIIITIIGFAALHSATKANLTFSDKHQSEPRISTTTTMRFFDVVTAAFMATSAASYPVRAGKP